MFYCCEVCGKKHTSEEKALECERLHEEEKAKREELAKEKEERIKDINFLVAELEGEIKKFRNDYGEYPPVNIAINKSTVFPFSFSYLFR